MGAIVEEQQKTNDSVQELLNIRERAINSLIPTIEQADNMSPEEQFGYLMTATRSAENNTILLAKALACAELMQDKREKLQALIDVINETTL